jgi:hypothetical protein
MISSASITKTRISPKVINYLVDLPDEIFEDRKKLIEKMRTDGYRRAADEIETMSNEDYDYFIMNAF